MVGSRRPPCRLHARRAARRDCDHRRAGGAAVARGAGGPRGGPPDAVRQQPQAARARVSQLSRYLQPVPRGEHRHESCNRPAPTTARARPKPTAGSTTGCGAGPSAIMPYIESGNLANQFDLNQRPYVPERSDIWFSTFGPETTHGAQNLLPCQQMPQSFICPSTPLVSGPVAVQGLCDQRRRRREHQLVLPRAGHSKATASATRTARCAWPRSPTARAILTCTWSRPAPIRSWAAPGTGSRERPAHQSVRVGQPSFAGPGHCRRAALAARCPPIPSPP